MKRWLKHQLWNVCWEIGDTFLGWSIKLGGPPDETWTQIDVHANCLPKPINPPILLYWDPARGLVEQAKFATSTNGYLPRT